MNLEEIRIDAAIEYAHDIIEGLDQLADISSDDESRTIKKVISTIEVMMAHDFQLTANKLDS
jgi:hypothetical protein